MPYIGKQPTVGNFQVCDAISVVNGQAAYTLQVGGVNVAPESANHMLVSLNGILQKPGSSFTISGSTITFASNLATGDVIDFVQILGNVLDFGAPSDDSVTTAKLAADAATAAKIADDAISDEHLDPTAITGQTTETTVADDDTVLIHDTSASALKKMTVSNLTANAGGGKLLQVVQSVSTASHSTSSTSYVAVTGTNNSVSITPSATSSKILISVTFMIRNETAGSSSLSTIFRDSTDLGSGSALGLEDQKEDNTFTLQFLDSPNTTSQVTYKVAHKTNNSSHPSEFNRHNQNVVYIAQEIGA